MAYHELLARVADNFQSSRLFDGACFVTPELLSAMSPADDLLAKPVSDPPAPTSHECTGV